METAAAPQDPGRSRSSAAPAHQEFITHREGGPGRNHGHGVEHNTPPGDSGNYADCPAFGRGNGARNFWTSPPPPPGDPRCWTSPVRGGPGRAQLPTLFQGSPRLFPMSERPQFLGTPPWRGYRGGPPPMPPWSGPRPCTAIRFSHEHRGALRGRPPFRRGGQSCHNLNAPHTPYLKQDTPPDEQARDGCLGGHASHSSQPNSSTPCSDREVPERGQDTLASGAVNRRRSRCMTHVGEERSSEVPLRQSARRLSRAAMMERENEVPCAEVSSTSGKCVEQRWKLRQRSSKRIEESEKRRQNSSRDSRAQKRASSVAAGDRLPMNFKALKGTPVQGRAAAPSDGRSVSTIRKSKEHRPTDSAHDKEHRRVSVARKTKHAEGRSARQKAQGKRSLTKPRSNNYEREKTPESVGRVGISTTPLRNEDIPPLPTAEQTTQMVLATGQCYGKEGPAPPNGESDCDFLDMNSTEAVTRKGASPDSTTLVSYTDAIAAEETTEKMTVEDSPWNASTKETECAEQKCSVTGGKCRTGGQHGLPLALGSPSAKQAQADEGNGQGFDILANVWWAQPYSSAAQDDSDIFMEPFFSEDCSYTELDDAAVAPDAEKEAAASNPSGVGSEGRQVEGARTSGASSGDVALEPFIGHAESSFSASSIDALSGEAPNSTSIVQRWLESSFAGTSGHCGIPEAAQPRDELETAHACDVRNVIE